HTRSYGDWSSDVCSSDLRHQADALQVLAARLRGDLDLALERILADHPQLGVTAFEQRLEEIAEVLLHLGEGLAEQLGRRDVDLRSEERRVGKEGRWWVAS